MKSIDITMKATYRGFALTYHESDKEWSVAMYKDPSAYSNVDLDKVKDYVDRVLKSDFKPFEAITRKTGWGSDDTFKKVTVTSVEVEGDGVWIKTDKGSRSKIDKDSLVAITPENEATIQEIQRIEAEIEKLESDKERAEKKLKQPELR